MTVDVESRTDVPESAASRGRPLYLDFDTGPLFAVLHTPEGMTSTLAVLLCPPFGWDELGAHRSLRAWAGTLAAAGHATLRIDLPGTGDSDGSPDDPGLVRSWISAVGYAARWLRQSRRCERVVAIGIGLGGMLATTALAEGAPIDDLVLWGVPPRGGLLLRELRAFATMVGPALPPGGDGPPPAEGVVSEPTGATMPDAVDASSSEGADDDGSLEAGGFVLTAETLGDLETVDLGKLEIPDAAARRVLLIGRDGIQPHRALREGFDRSGVELTQEGGEGYGAMMKPPQYARRPESVFKLSVDWIGRGGHGEMATDGEDQTGTPDGELEAAEHDVAGLPIVERPFDVEFEGQRRAGILAESRDVARTGAPLAAILLNAGAIRRIGPNRMWVEAARRWAARGVPTLRIDAIGLGDADGCEQRYTLNRAFYRPEVTGQVSAILDEMGRAGFGARFLVGGLCSGAYWGFHTSLEDPRIRALALINLWAFYWTDELAAARDRARARTMIRSRSWREMVRIAMGRGRVGRIDGLRAAIGSMWPEIGKRRGVDRVGEALKAIGSREIETLLLFSEGEPLYDEYFARGWTAELEHWPTITLGRSPVRDHLFHAVPAQRFVHERLDEALERSLGRVRGDRPAPPAAGAEPTLPLG